MGGGGEGYTPRLQKGISLFCFDEVFWEGFGEGGSVCFALIEVLLISCFFTRESGAPPYPPSDFLFSMFSLFLRFAIQTVNIVFLAFFPTVGVYLTTIVYNTVIRKVIRKDKMLSTTKSPSPRRVHLHCIRDPTYSQIELFLDVFPANVCLHCGPYMTEINAEKNGDQSTNRSPASFARCPQPFPFPR